MTYLHLAYLHLATVVPAFFIGTFLLLNRKGDRRHKSLGKAYMILMLITAGATMVMPAKVGPALFNHFGFIHLFSFLILYSVPVALVSIRKGNVRRHRANMIGLYVGGILIAGAFALSPGRLLHDWLFGG